MEENFDMISEVKRIENEFLILFGKEELGKLIELQWENVKQEYIGKPNAMELATRLMLEDLIIYCIASGEKDGYEKIIEIKENTNLPITIKPYEETEKHYEKYINTLREHLKNDKNK